MAEKGRSFAAVPKPERDDASAPEPSSKRSWFELPDGALGILFLLVLSSLCGALIAVYWPFAQGGSEIAVGDRVSTLETKVDEIAAGHAPIAAAQVFISQRRETAAFKSRLDADEARLAAMEKSQGAADSVDLASLKTGTEKTASNMTQLSDRLAKLELALGPAAAGAIASVRAKALQDQMANFERRVAELEKSAPPAGLAQKLDSFALKSEEGALETRILQLETQDMTGVMRRAAAVMALADLVRASSGSEPFGEELAVLKSLAPASPELQDLTRYAAKGVPTRNMLAESFAHQIDAILASEHPNSKSLSDRIWSGVVNVVTVRPIRNMVGNDSEAHLARAQVDLNIGELSRAVREVSALSGPAKEAAGPWLKSANERITVDRDARALAQRLVSNLSAQPAAAQTAGGAAPAK